LILIIINSSTNTDATVSSPAFVSKRKTRNHTCSLKLPVRQQPTKRYKRPPNRATTVAIVTIVAGTTFVSMVDPLLGVFVGDPSGTFANREQLLTEMVDVISPIV
jgi:hypothetical protein